MNSAEPFLQPYIVQPQRVCDRIYAMLPRQFHCGLPQWFRQLRPYRLCAAELIELTLQLYDRLRDRYLFTSLRDL